jgi:hypothetical protein
VRVIREWRAFREIEPEALARLFGWSVTSGSSRWGCGARESRKLPAPLSLTRPGNYSQIMPARRSTTFWAAKFADHAAIVDLAAFRLSPFPRPSAASTAEKSIAKFRVGAKRQIEHSSLPGHAAVVLDRTNLVALARSPGPILRDGIRWPIPQGSVSPFAVSGLVGAPWALLKRSRILVQDSLRLS